MKAFNITILSTAMVLYGLPGFAQDPSSNDTAPTPAQQGRWRRADTPPPVTGQTPDDQPAYSADRSTQPPMDNGDNGSVVSSPDMQQAPDPQDAPQGPPQGPPPQSNPDNGGWQNGPPPPPANAGPQSQDPWGRYGQSRGGDMGPRGNMPQRSDRPYYRQPAPPTSMTLPAGTWVTIRVNEPLSSDHNQAGDAFMGTLAQPLVVNGLVLAQRGQMVSGRVTEAVKAGRAKGLSHLGVELTTISLADGQQINVHSQMMERRGETSYGRDAAAIGVTTGTGAAIGAAVNGGVGAAVGAGAGLVVSTVGVLLTRGRPTVVYPEQPLTFSLVNPVTVTADFTNEAFVPVSQGDYQNNGLQTRPQPYGGGYGYSAAYPYAYSYPYPYYGGYYPYYGWGGFWGPSIYIGGYYGRGYYGGGYYGRGYYGRGYYGGGNYGGSFHGGGATGSVHGGTSSHGGGGHR